MRFIERYNGYDMYEDGDAIVSLPVITCRMSGSHASVAHAATA